MTSLAAPMPGTVMGDPALPNLNPAAAVRAVMSWRDKYIKEEPKPIENGNEKATDPRIPIRPPEITNPPTSHDRPLLSTGISYTLSRLEVSPSLDSEPPNSQEAVRTNSGPREGRPPTSSFRRGFSSRSWVEDRTSFTFTQSTPQTKYFGGRTKRGERDPSIPSIKSGRRYHPTTGRIYYDDDNPNPLWPSSAPTGPAIDPLTGLPDQKKQKIGSPLPLPTKPKEKRKVSFTLPEDGPRSCDEEEEEEEGEIVMWEKRSAWDEYKSGDLEKELMGGKSEDVKMKEVETIKTPSVPSLPSSPPEIMVDSSAITSSSLDPTATIAASPSPESTTATNAPSPNDTSLSGSSPPAYTASTTPVERSTLMKLPSFKKRKSSEMMGKEEEDSDKQKVPIISHSDTEEEESSELTEIVPSGDMSIQEEDDKDRMSVQEDADEITSSNSDDDMDMSDSDSQGTDSDSYGSESESAVSTEASKSSSESFHPPSQNATATTTTVTTSRPPPNTEPLAMPKVGSVWRTRDEMTEACKKASAAAGYGWKSVHGYGTGKGREVIWGCTRIKSKARFDEQPCPARMYYKPVNPNKWENGKWRIHRAYEHNHPPEKELEVAVKKTGKRRGRPSKKREEVEVPKKRGPGRPRKHFPKVVVEEEVSEDELESDTEEEVVLRKRVKTWVAGTQGSPSSSNGSTEPPSLKPDRFLTPTPALQGRQTNNSASTRLPTPPPSLLGSPAQRALSLTSSTSITPQSPPPYRPAPPPSFIANKLAKARYISEAEPNDISSFLCSLDPTWVKYTSNLTVAGLREKSQLVGIMHWSKESLKLLFEGSGIPKKVCGKMVDTLKVASESIVSECP